MTAFATHFGFEFRTGIRNKTLLLMNYLFPLGFYLMMGLVMTGINPNFRDVLLPAMVAFAVLASTILGLPDPLVSARESGIFRSYKINGVPAASILAIPAVATALHLSIVSLIIMVTAPLFFSAPVPVSWGMFVLVSAAFMLTCTGLGVLIGVIAPSTRMTVLYSQLIFLPSMLLGGMMMPFDFLPPVAQKVALLLPSTHAMNAFNGLAMGTTATLHPWVSVLALIATGVLACGLSLLLFRWDGNSKPRYSPLLALLVVVPFALTLFAM